MKAVQLKGGAENIMNGVAKAEPVRGVNKKRKISAEDEGRMPASFSSSSSRQQSTIEENWGESKITPKRQANIDFYLLRFIVCCFVAFSLLDSGFFIDFVLALYVMSLHYSHLIVVKRISRCPGYSVPDRSAFFGKHLANEAAQATAKLTAYLLLLSHLTLSFDGWSSKGHDEIYTISITTALRRSFLFDCLVLTGLPTDGQYLSERLSKVCAM